MVVSEQISANPGRCLRPEHRRNFDTGNDVQEAPMPWSAGMRESGDLDGTTTFAAGFTKSPHTAGGAALSRNKQ